MNLNFNKKDEPVINWPDPDSVIEDALPTLYKYRTFDVPLGESNIFYSVSLNMLTTLTAAGANIEYYDRVSKLLTSIDNAFHQDLPLMTFSLKFTKKELTLSIDEITFFVEGFFSKKQLPILRGIFNEAGFYAEASGLRPISYYTLIPL